MSPPQKAANRNNTPNSNASPIAICPYHHRLDEPQEVREELEQPGERVGGFDAVDEKALGGPAARVRPAALGELLQAGL